jgi:hypothetical protein
MVRAQSVDGSATRSPERAMPSIASHQRDVTTTTVVACHPSRCALNVMHSLSQL